MVEGGHHGFKRVADGIRNATANGPGLEVALFVGKAFADALQLESVEKVSGAYQCEVWQPGPQAPSV